MNVAEQFSVLVAAIGFICILVWIVFELFQTFVAWRCNACKKWFKAENLEIHHRGSGSCSETDMSIHYYLCKACNTKRTKE